MGDLGRRDSISGVDGRRLPAPSAKCDLYALGE